jgi:hypothetical protein
MPVTNPFAGIGIGASRDPSLTQTTVDAARGLSDARARQLSGTIQGINTLAQQRLANQGGLERVKETGEQTRQSQSLLRGIDLARKYQQDPTVSAQFEEDRTTQLANIAAQAVANQAVGGVYPAGPSKGETWSQAQIAAPGSPGRIGTPTALLSNPTYTTLTGEAKRQVVTEEMLQRRADGTVGPGYGMLVPTTTTTTSSVKGVSKGDIDQGLLESLMNMVFADVRTGKFGPDKMNAKPQIQAGSVVSGIDEKGNPALIFSMDFGLGDGMQQWNVPISDLMPNE